jgi:hypothetical protein
LVLSVDEKSQPHPAGPANPAIGTRSSSAFLTGSRLWCRWQARPCHPRQLRRPQASQSTRLAHPAPRWTFHFTPTSCSWANAVETFFASLTRRRLQRGAFHSLVDLEAAINRYLGEHNRKPKPFVWTADPDRIVEKVNRGYQVMASNP